MRIVLRQTPPYFPICAVSHGETTHIATPNGPYRRPKQPVLPGKTGCFAPQSGGFCNWLRSRPLCPTAMEQTNIYNFIMLQQAATAAGNLPTSEKKHTPKLPFSRFYSLHLQKISGDRETAAEPTHTPTMHFRTPAASLPGTSCTADMKKRDARQGG